MSWYVTLYTFRCMCPANTGCVCSTVHTFHDLVDSNHTWKTRCCEECFQRDAVAARRRRVFVHPCSGSACCMVLFRTRPVWTRTRTHRTQICPAILCCGVLLLQGFDQHDRLALMVLRREKKLNCLSCQVFCFCNDSENLVLSKCALSVYLDVLQSRTQQSVLQCAGHVSGHRMWTDCCVWPQCVNSMDWIIQDHVSETN